MIRVADYIAQTLARHGIRHVFMVTGGGAMHLNDAIGRCKGLSFVCCHHEQACAMAADSYFRLTNRLAAVNVTTGPGGTNAITGVFGAWTDSLGMVVISGQVKWETLVRSTGLPLRQLGDQEVDIIRLVEPITKYAVLVTDPDTIRYHLERALHLARTGRPGPVWLDVPINVQGALVDETALPGYDPSEDRTAFATEDLDAACREVLARVMAAERPVIMAGSGVRISGAHADFVRLVTEWGIPVTTTWNAHDVLWNGHPSYVGRPGSIGDRAGNFAVQNADLLLVLGCRLNIRQVSYDWKKFARAAFKIMVDVDEAELKKPTLAIDLPVHADLAEFLPCLLSQGKPGRSATHSNWLAWCRERAERYPTVLPEYWETSSGINPYCFAETLFDQIADDQVVVTGDGTACVVTFQAAKLRERQRLYTNSGCASMGYDLPAAIGACVAEGGRRPIVCLAGDGSIQMNLQELQTIAGRKLPIKLFILNNWGYHSIRQTQQNYFADNIVGCGLDSGLSFPDFGRLAHAYGLPFRRVESHDGLAQAVSAALEGDGPQVCEVVLDLAQAFAPKLASKKLADGRMVSAPLEDLTPLLDRDEFARNMIIPPLPE